MFWVNKGSEAGFEPNHKYKFIAIFYNFSYSDGRLPLNSSQSETKDGFLTSVKKIDLPKINFDFERSYANEYVHYFQNGSIHWEPISITFIDTITSGKGYFENVRSFFAKFIDSVPIVYSGSNTRNTFSLKENRTGVIDLPVLCESIQIQNIARFPLSDYPTYKTGDLVGSPTAKFKDGNIDSFSSLNYDGFVIQRPRITKIDFGSLDYSSDEINEVTITVVPEWCDKI